MNNYLVLICLISLSIGFLYIIGGSKNKHHHQKHKHPKRHNIGGCEGTRYGCCEGSSIAKEDVEGSNCYNYKPHKIGGCEGTRYGCCEGSSIAKLDKFGSNC